MKPSRRALSFGLLISLMYLLAGLAQLPSKTERVSTNPLIVRFPTMQTSVTGEVVGTDTLQGEVRVVAVAPPADDSDAGRPARLLLYALPNGNTIEQTMGRRLREGIDWHYGIQHIGAQTRRLREIVQDWNIVVAYLEAPSLSWPHWTKTHVASAAIIRGIVDSLRARVRGMPVTVTLAGHSGGGSFIFGMINAVDDIPLWIDRISFLDSNYGYDPEAGHHEKLVRWLRTDSSHVLSVIAYDDREIVLNGKKVVGPDGGTYRRSLRMREDMRDQFALRDTIVGNVMISGTPDRRMEFLIHRNPGNEILHTVLVERNGFLHAMVLGTKYESAAGDFWGKPAYDGWIEE